MPLLKCFKDAAWIELNIFCFEITFGPVYKIPVQEFA